MYSHLGMVPRVGDTVELPGVVLTVRELEGVRITRVQAKLRPETAANEGDEG